MWLNKGSVKDPGNIIFIILWRQLERMRTFTQARTTGQDGRECWTKNMKGLWETAGKGRPPQQQLCHEFRGRYSILIVLLN